jgi:amino acid transporter
VSVEEATAHLKASRTDSRPTLIAALTVWDLTAIAINGIIGAGIFGLPALAAGMLGASSPIAFVLCAIIVSFFVLCFAEVASHFSETGGPYIYSRALFGPFVAFQVGWSAWLARVSSFAANSNLLVSYLAFFLPQVASGIYRALVLASLALTLAMVNIRGVSAGARFGDAFAVMKVAALLLFGAAGLAFVDWTRFSGISISTDANWGGAILLVLYAFTGFENAVIPAGESKNPRRDTGWALILALGVCAAIYCAVQVVVVGILPDPGSSERPLADAAQNFVGPGGAGLISLLACVSVIGNISGSALIGPRLTYAFSQRGDFPSLFGKLHRTYRTPVPSIILFTAVAALLAITGQFVWLATISVLARLTNYAVTCLALPLLRKRSSEPPAFRVPLGPLVSVIGTVLCVWLFMQATWTDLGAFGLASVAGAVVYLVRPRS